MEGNLSFKIDWASLTVGSKFAVFALRAIFQLQAPAVGGRGGGGGLIFGGAI